MPSIFFHVPSCPLVGGFTEVYSESSHSAYCVHVQPSGTGAIREWRIDWVTDTDGNGVPLGPRICQRQDYGFRYQPRKTGQPSDCPCVQVDAIGFS